MTTKRIKYRRSNTSKREDGKLQSKRSSRSSRAKLSLRRSQSDSAASSSSPSSKPTTPTPAEAGLIRVSKLMSARGMCSRREADYYIEQGWVYVDDVKIDALGTRVHESQEIRLSKVAEKRQQRRVTVLLHKPPGYVSGQPEKGYTAAVSLVKPSNYIQFRGSQEKPPPRLTALAPAGRLDIDSEGLLVLTQDGRVARTLIGPESDIEKEYLVRVEGEITEQRIAQLKHGLSLDGRALRPAKIEKRAGPNLRFVLTEGRKRQIRRMCELVDLKVIRLQRVRIGQIKLGRLPPGKWRYLRQHESF